jgi:hypothetical protein
MEFLIYSASDLIVGRKEIKNIHDSGSVLAYRLLASEDYKLKIKTIDIASRRDEWVFKLVDKQEEGGRVCVVVHNNSNVPYLVMDDGGDRVHLAKGLGQKVTIKGVLDQLEFRISANVRDCEVCDFFLLRIYLEKHDALYQDYALTQQESLEYVKNIPIVLVSPN